MDGGAWKAVVHGVTEGQTRLKWLSSSSGRGSISITWQLVRKCSLCRHRKPEVLEVDSRNCVINKPLLHNELRTSGEMLLSCSVVSNSLWPHGCSLPGFSEHGILQARIPEWVAIFSSRASFQPRDQTHISCVSCIAGGLFTGWAVGKPKTQHLVSD